jgi:hypothetical protein
MSNEYKITYNVDMVFCIDATGSMSSVINMVKKNAINFYSDVIDAMAKKSKTINRLRVRIVAFRDYLADGEKAMLVTDFFTLPDDAVEFEKCVKSINAEGGGDEPEDGLEALGYAIKSKWDIEGMKKRQVIVVWTDASTHELGFGKSDPNYPSKMAKDFSELTAWWGDKQNAGFVNQNAKRLLLFAPGAKYWGTISDNWDNVIHFPSTAGNGLNEFDYSQIIDSISNTI